MFKKFLVVAFITSIALPVFVAAQTTDSQSIAELEQMVRGLVKQVEELQARLYSQLEQISVPPSNSGPGGSGGASSSPGIAVSQCVRLSRGLYLGTSDKETGSEVSALQKHLKSTGDYDYPEITGYFGPATERAVKSFQSRNGIVTQGDADSTGFGVIGPSTRSAIAKGCVNPVPPVQRISVTYPKGGENMVTGDPMLIRWTPTVPVSVIEIISTAGNYSFGIYGPKYGNTTPLTTGEYTYVVVSTTPAGSYYVRVTPADGSVQAVSKIFTINSINQLPSITVLSPNGGETLQKNTTQTIRWNSTNLLSSSLIDIGLTDQYCAKGSSNDIANGISNTGVYSSASLPTNIVDGNYRMMVSVHGSVGVFDCSDSFFTVQSATSQPSITVISPNGGSYSQLNPLNISWTPYSGDFDYYYLFLGNKLAGGSSLSPNQNISKINVSFTANNLSEVIKEIIANSGGKTAEQIKDSYYIEIDAVKNDRVGGSIIYRTFSVPFTITSDISQPSITVISPNGGEVFARDSRLNVSWRSNALTTSSMARVELRKGSWGGQVVLYSEVANTGSASLPLSAYFLTGTDYKIRVSDAANSAVYDESDSVFSISGAVAPSSPVTFSNTGTRDNEENLDQMAGVIQSLWDILAKLSTFFDSTVTGR